MLSEFADNFGPAPITGFQGVNPDYVSVEEVYDFVLTELDEAVGLIDTSVTNPNNLGDWDPAYGYSYEKWIKYGNSLRMRLAMRLSEVAPAKAQQHFEDAVSGGYISAAEDNFAVQENDGWNALTGVMTRQWNSQYMSPTYRYLTMWLGGVPSTDLLAADLHGNVKPAGDLGIKYEDHLGVLNNDPTQGFWLDGVPNTVDPRAYSTFALPGDVDNPDFNQYPTWSPPTETEVSFIIGEEDSDDNGETNDIDGDAAFTYNAFPIGDGGDKIGNISRSTPATQPRLVHRYRDNANKRIMFGSWESHFLVAEAAVRGWSVPMSGKAAYEQGISDSFEYVGGISGHLGAYLASQDYNGAGTSVSWDHTAEPPASVAMDYVDGYTGAPGVHNYTYPENTIYQGGNVKNDWMNKIMTQKFIAQTPWLPLEVWNDHRRLGLPFFENPALENPLPNNPSLTAGNINSNSVSVFPQRVRYPSSVVNNLPATYQQAVGLLGGDDSIFTPLWWAKQN